MASKIEDYALIGDCQTAALVGRDGSIDWLCVPRFDSGACFAALLGTPEHGRWRIAPVGEVRATRRRYRDDTLVLETEFEMADGSRVALIDFMPPRSELPDLVRIVEGRKGRVPLRLELVIRFDYGSVVPWVRGIDRGISAIAGPDMLVLRTDVELRGEGLTTVADFEVAEGHRIGFDLTWFPSNRPQPTEIDTDRALDETEAWWREWSGRCNVQGEWSDAVRRSLITLKALTFAPTGGIVAAPTTSLPESLGGVRNWDYRYCWLRDASFTLFALLRAGYRDEAAAWREWLLRAVAGSPCDMHIMYGIAGERRLNELELSWLPGYENSQPVRIGNGAWDQHQLDVYGGVLAMLYECRVFGMERDGDAWKLENAILDYLESNWHEPDEGIWEVRGPRRHFTQSKVMAWLAFDRAVKSVEEFGLDGPVDRWREHRDAIHDEVCLKGFDAERNAFVQSYGGNALDASLLTIPLVGFLPADDPRMLGTVEAIQKELLTDGFVRRYAGEPEVDGLPASESSFLLCTFWLADNLALQGRHDEARRIFERLLAIRNDVGLLSEGYDVEAGRLVGNFPQAFSHIGLVNTALRLATGDEPPGCGRD